MFHFKKYAKEKYARYALLIILIGFLIRLLLAIFSTTSGDACWHLSASRFIARNFAVPLFEPIGRDVFWAPPLFHILTAINYILFSSILGEISLKLISPIFGTLFLLYSFLLIKKLFNSKIAFFSTIFLTFIPEHVYHSSIAYIDVPAAFFVVASIYYMLENRLFISSIFAGLAFLTKTNTFFILPVIFYIILANSKKGFLKKSLIFVLVSFAIASPWYIRNWVYLGNPAYPYLNNLFNGYESMSSVSLTMNAEPFTLLTTFYLSLFGVPNGNVNNLLVLNPLLIFIWLAVTAVFFSFFIFGLFRMKKTMNFNIINILFISFFAFNLLVSLSINTFVIRLMMPAILFFSLYWAVGIESIKFKKIIIVIVVVSVSVFIFGEFSKSFVANNMWNIYEDDFNWVKNNIEKDAIILTPNSQCNSYKFDRYTYSIGFFEFINKVGPKDFLNYNISYIFYPEVGDLVISKFDINLSESISNSKLIYENNSTHIKIYRLKHELY